MTDFSPTEISIYYTNRAPAIRQSNAKVWRGKCPIHSGKDDNFAVDSTTGLWTCHSQCGRSGDLLSLEMELGGLEFVKAKESIFTLMGRPAPDYTERDIVATFDYSDEAGNLRYQVVRRHPKRFGQRRPDGSGWIWNLNGIERLPFNLANVVKSDKLVLCEGERDVLSLRRLGITASCNSEGAGNWKPELNQWFAGKDVVLLPDNDEPGRAHVLKVAAQLHGKAARIRILELPGLSAKGDASDWIQSGGDAKQFSDLVTLHAQEYTPEFKFVLAVPSEEDRWVHAPAEIIERAGGMDKFWDLASVEGIATPFTELTEMLTGGLRNGEVYLIGGTRGCGKTSLALRFVSRALAQKKGVLLYSLEMGQADVLRRMISIEERINLAQLRILQKKKAAKEMLPRDMECLENLESALGHRAEKFSRLPLLVHQKPSVSPKYLIDETKRLKERQKLDLICIDHMQLMSSDGNEKKEYEKFTAISRAMKGEVARELNVPVLVVSQVSRTNSTDKRSELEMTDLRGSGALEEDAAAVMLLYHDAADMKQAASEDAAMANPRSRLSKGPLKAWLKLAKNRFGQSPTYLELIHWKNYTRFDSTDERDEEIYDGKV